MEIKRIWYPAHGRYLWAVYCQFRGYIAEELETQSCAEAELEECLRELYGDDA